MARGPKAICTSRRKPPDVPAEGELQGSEALLAHFPIALVVEFRAIGLSAILIAKDPICAWGPGSPHTSRDRTTMRGSGATTRHPSPQPALVRRSPNEAYFRAHAMAVAA